MTGFGQLNSTILLKPKRKMSLAERITQRIPVHLKVVTEVHPSGEVFPVTSPGTSQVQQEVGEQAENFRRAAEGTLGIPNADKAAACSCGCGS